MLTTQINRCMDDKLKKKIVLSVFLFISIFIIYLLRNTIIVKFDDKTTVGIIIKTVYHEAGEASGLEIWYKYKVEEVFYYENKFHNSVIGIPEPGYKFRIHYFSKYPSIHIVRLREKIEEDTTISL